MYDQGLITESQYYEAKAEQLVFTRSADADKPATLYNWYDEQVLTDVINDLMDKYGYSKTLATDMVTSGRNEAGALGQGQLAQILVEVVLRGGGHAVAVVAQVNVVQIPFHNLVLGIGGVKHGTENRKMVTYDQIPTDLVNATIAIEDKTFRTHKGVNWRRTLYGVFLMFTGQDIQGGSTITQQ